MDDLQSILAEPEVLEILKNALKSNYRLVSYVIKPASDNPKGFLGEHYLLKAEVSTDGQTKQLSYFVKKTPEILQHLHYVQSTRAFYKEVEMYKTVFTALCSKMHKPTKWLPEYYYSRGAELLVLEDLSSAGYYMYPERCYMDEEHLVASLRALAAMHAASFAYEETGFGSFAHLMFETEVTGVKGHPGNNFHEAAIGGPVKIIEYLNYTDAEKRIIRERLPDVLRGYFQLVKTSERYKNVFVHGDLWANNVLFRRDPAGGVDAVIVDFQLVRYAPPAHDIMMFLHFVQSKEYLQERQEFLLKSYYAALSEELEKNSLRPEVVLPWEDFVDSCGYYEDLGLISKIFFFQLILAPSDVSTRFLSSPELFVQNFLTDRTEMVVKCFQQDETCRRRMTEAINDVVEKFILRN